MRVSRSAATTPEGQLAKDVLVRSYRDGSVVVLALGSKEPGKLVLKRRDSDPMPFELPARGVFVCDKDSAPKSCANGLSKTLGAFAPLQEEFALSLDGPNTFRLVFASNGVARLKVAQAVDGVRLAVRCYPEPYALTLDGKVVSADASCDTLRQGFNELCLQTAPFRLDAGEHEVALATGGKEDSVYYFPVAWLTGTFAVKDHVVKPLPQKAGAGALWRQGLANYVGSVTYTLQADVPKAEGELRLRLDTGGLYAAISLDGKPLGERVWAPFEWTVPAGLKGKRAELKITVWTSIAPIFGDVNAPESIWSKKLWIAAPLARAEVGLVASPQWIVK